MTGRNVNGVDSVYSGGSTKRSRCFDDISCSNNVSARWTSILSCCWRRKRERKPPLEEYNLNEWDYIVEKFVVKRVPLALYATENDFREFIESRKDIQSSYGPIAGPAVKETSDKQVYTTVPGAGSTLYYFKNKGRRDLSDRPSNKNLRFNRDEDMLDEDAVQAGPSNYKDRNMLTSRKDELENEYLNQFSSLHPNLKDSERPPKDPHPLNQPRSKRSLAEDISEIASSTKKTPNVKNKKGKGRSSHGTNDYIQVNDTPRRTSAVLRDEEIPTRDKNLTKHTSSIGRKIGSASYLPYPKQQSKVPRAESPEIKQIRREMVTQRGLQNKILVNPIDRDFYPNSTLKAPQFKVHYVSPEPHSSNKLTDLSSRNLDEDVTSQTKNHSKLSDSRKIANREEFVSDATSYTSEDIKDANLAGTSLRWKIIIKHHQPATASQTPSESPSDFPHSFPLLTSNDGLSRPELKNANIEYYDKIKMEEHMDK